MSEPLRHVEHVMGTVFSFDVRTPPTPRIRAALTVAVDWLHHVDAVFSPYRPDSQISRLRDGTLTLAECDPDVRDILAFCAEVAAETGGRFTASPGGRLDPSGAVKGWAIERASDLLFAAGAVDHCVNGGGDVQARGGPAPGEPWRIGVADPRDRTRVAAVVEGRDVAVATSGTAERGPHIIDPATGRPATALLSLTLAGRALTRTDALATAAFAMGAEACAWLAARPGLHACTVTAAGDVRTTPAFTARGDVPWLCL
ncbi:Thiamine biosynthesis lipoprotein ApbE precursor [Actinomadura rubteroloni]|uniref:FAD:protein FMN transferase n=1 Tax=Actinomadura rubteroloni TaxID=1926885 RepID=A0A2P4UN23_9ACTN|nr:FAD:protein FMN transferase [Actinomadura rubteroloni]POM26409.1 Thiamine biosynthesis lipoprotein ApbE precursor [Actinomadura rubteroloni]